MQTALAEGVNCILLQVSARPDIVQRVEKVLGVRGVEMAHFWVFYTGEEEIDERND